MSIIDRVEIIPVNILYTHQEVSAQVNRGGVSDVVLKLYSSDGAVGWGECCSGADTISIVNAAAAMLPFVIGRSPFDLDAMRRDVYWDGLWQFRKGTANFTWAGFEMAVLDLQGKLSQQPVYQLLGGKMRDSVDYFYYLSRGSTDELKAQCHDGVDKGFSVFYLKVGIDFANELNMIRAIREVIGSSRKIRLDANTAWTVPQAKRYLAMLDDYDVEFVEGPIVSDVSAMNELMRHQFKTGICMNEGLWTKEDALERIEKQACDYLNFSPYWVGSFFDFKWLSSLAGMRGIPTCKHTHGEFSIAAMACQHALLNLPCICDGHQQTAYLMQDDIATEAIPISHGASWGVPTGTGLCIDIDEDKLAFYHQHFVENGQLLPYKERGNTANGCV